MKFLQMDIKSSHYMPAHKLYRRSAGRKKGEEHPRYKEAIRWLRDYNGASSFVLSVKETDANGWDLSKPQINKLIEIMEQVHA